MFSYQNVLPISEITFKIGDNINSCYENLTKRGYSKVEGDLRVGGRGKFVALGYKRANYTCEKYISNIIGVVSESTMPFKIYENGLEYTMVIDENGNGDINKGSHGFYIYLYYIESDKLMGLPIKELIFQSSKNALNTHVETVNNSSNSKRKGKLDINAGRGGSSPFNYILIIR